MALINCPECNKEISDKANSCPHCGYPIEAKINEDDLYDVVYYGITTRSVTDRTQFVEIIADMKQTDFSNAVKLINDKQSTLFRGLSSINANTLFYIFSTYAKVVVVPTTSTISENYKVDAYINKVNAPATCPNCGSTLVAKVQQEFGFFSTFLFGKNKNVNRCGECGYRW